MAPFQIQCQYRDVDKNSENELGSGDELDFEIDSDVSDTELQELRQELKKLEPRKVQRELADATLALQKMNMERWERYCEHIRKDLIKQLKKCQTEAFMLFFVWYRKSHLRAKRLDTYESIWKGLRQLFYDQTRKVVNDDVGKLISNWLHGKFCDDNGLIRGMRQKHVIGHQGLYEALYYHWKFDIEIFPLERERVQLAAVLLFSAYTGSRLGAIIESGCAGIRGTNAALLYKDVKLRLLRTPGEEPLLILEVTIRLDKGKRKRSQPKTITLYENPSCPAMCAVVHFAALAFADNAFHPRLVSEGLTVHSLHSFSCPDGRITIDFSFKDEILDTPVFRRSIQTIDGVSVDPHKALSANSSANSISYQSRRLGQRAGFDYPLTPYALRREVGTECTDNGISDIQRNQILGHAKSETFFKHYLSQRVVVDVQAIFLGHTSRSDLIKEIGKLFLRRDFNLPKALTDIQKKHAHDHNDILKLEQKKTALKLELKCEFGTIAKGSSSLKGIEYKKLNNKINALKICVEREAFEKLLQDFHSTADLDHMVAQLRGEEPASSMLAPVEHVLEERRRLAEDLFLPVTDSSFAKIVESMASLCVRFEERGCRTATEPHNISSRMADPLEHGEPPIASIESFATVDYTMAAKAAQISNAPALSKPIILAQAYSGTNLSKVQKSLPPLTCLFCYGKPGRKQLFARKDVLRKYCRFKHFQYQIGAFPCPISSCNSIILDPDHFSNHATIAHKSNLGTRASIMRLEEHTTKPGQLVSFVV